MSRPPFSLAASIGRRVLRITPGVVLCLAVSAAAWMLQGVEAHVFGRAWIETLVLAILVGAAARTAWTPGRVWAAGVEFSAKTILEMAVVLLGATIDARTIVSAGPLLLLGIGGVVAVAIAVSYGLGRLFRLPRRMAMLVACGNAICGNSAIAAVAPVIGADGEDVTAAIAFTAVLGVGVVLGLPPLATALHMSPRAFGAFAGLTVYAVPQVLAATAPFSQLSAQVGTVVKLVRVLMLGPVVTVLSIANLDDRGQAGAAPANGDARSKAGRPTLRHLTPWFIVGFLLLVGMRSVAPIPARLVAGAGSTATALTIVSMAALGLGVDVRALVRAGLRVSVVVTLSLGVLGLLALLLVDRLALS